MLKRLLSVAAVVVGLVAWVSRAHAQDIAVPLWGYMHYADWNFQGCTSCDPSTTPRVPGSVERPYDVVIYDLADPYTPIIPEYDSINGYWIYRTYEVHTGHTYRIIVSKHSSSAGACAIQSCIYQVTWNGGAQQDVKMHADQDQVPYGGGDVGPSSYTNPCNPEGVKLAWAGGALRIRAEKPAKLNLKLYDVSGKLLLEKRVSVKAGESTVELPVKGLNVLVVQGEDFTKTLKLVK